MPNEFTLHTSSSDTQGMVLCKMLVLALTVLIATGHAPFKAVPSPASSLDLYRNGMFQLLGVDLPLSSDAVRFSAVPTPQAGNDLVRNRQ